MKELAGARNIGLDNMRAPVNDVPCPLLSCSSFRPGVRIGELCALRYDDIEGTFIHVQRMFRPTAKQVVEHTKTEEGGRLIPLTDKALENKKE